MMESLHPFDPVVLFPQFRLGIYRIVFYAPSPLRLPDYPGSTWRGALGRALRHLNCPWKEKTCPSCETSDSCAYGVLFEKDGKEIVSLFGKDAKKAGFDTLPRPYVIRPLMPSGNYWGVEMVLIGDAAHFLPHVLAAWEQAGRNGIGKGRNPCILSGIFQYQPDGSRREIYGPEGPGVLEQESWLLADYLSYLEDPPPPWEIKVLTPHRRKEKGKYSGDGDWVAIWKRFAVRISLLNTVYHRGSFPDKWDGLELFFANFGAAEGSLEWYDWERYSSTQDRKVPMGGGRGNSLIRPPRGLEKVWWRWWQTASLLHIGKGATMGMGHIRVIASVANHED